MALVVKKCKWDQSVKCIIPYRIFALFQKLHKIELLANTKSDLTVDITVLIDINVLLRSDVVFQNKVNRFSLISN